MASESKGRREDPPPEVPGYEVLAPIGRGASGVVYRARSKAVDREVAIKVLHAHLSHESRLVRRLQREARTTARLAHPHIVSAVDMGEVEGRWWYAMEFVDGPSLAQRLKAEGRIREREALRLFIPVCEALEHLWEHGVVHRDIKPANILIDRAGGARLADLGLAFAEDDPSITGTGGTLGTPHYISPEQAVDPRKADVRSDIWSYGATLFHAVCGRPPFAGDSAAEVLSAVLYARVPDPEELEPQLSRRLALVLRKCLTRAPARRYQDPHELLLDLERVRERRPPLVRKRALDPVARNRAPLRRAGLVGGALAGIGLTAAIFFLPTFLRGSPHASAADPAAGAPFGPLEELFTRREEGGITPAELLAELTGLEPRVPGSQRARFEDLARTLDADLRGAARVEQREVESRLDGFIASGDLESAWRLVPSELDPRFLRRTGYDIEGLARAGVNLGPWRDRLGLELESATETALSELEAALQDWRNARRSEVEARLVLQDWESALAALTVPATNVLLAEAGFNVRLPEASLRGLLDELSFEFRLRAERLRDDWQELDRDLRSWVLKRRGTLERALGETVPRIPAADMLRADFERELFDRGLALEEMPNGVSHLALEELETSAAALLELEEHLLEADARADFDEVQGLADDALRRRAYENARVLWEEARARLIGAERFPDSAWRLELVRRTDVRRTECVLLENFLARVSERVWKLDGQQVQLQWRSITYPSARIQAGSDVLHQGFRAEGVAGTIELALLPPPQIEAFAGYGPEADLAPIERLTLALFHFHDGRPHLAQRVLFSGDLPTSAPESFIGPDLADRIASALERAELRSDERESEARRLYESVVDADFTAHNPKIAQQRLARLLDEFTDVPFIRQQRQELLKLRAGLEPDREQRGEPEFRKLFDPDVLELSPLGRVTLRYDFSKGRTGAWDLGDWIYDGLGLALGPRRVNGWDELAAERGLELALREPFVTDSVDITLRLEALAGEQPARLLWLTAVGFQVALSAPELPGTRPGPRFLVGTDDGPAFLQRVLANEGQRAEAVLVPGGPQRELRFKAARRAGRYELYLDGVLLQESSGLRAPPPDARSLVFRSWGTVRILSISVDGTR